MKALGTVHWPLSVGQRLHRLSGHGSALVDHIAVRPNVIDPEALFLVEGARLREQRSQLSQSEWPNEKEKQSGFSNCCDLKTDKTP